MIKINKPSVLFVLNKGDFNELKVEAKDYMFLIKKISLKNNIDENENILKTSKKRKKAKKPKLLLI